MCLWSTWVIQYKLKQQAETSSVDPPQMPGEKKKKRIGGWKMLAHITFIQRQVFHVYIYIKKEKKKKNVAVSKGGKSIHHFFFFYIHLFIWFEWGGKKISPEN